MIIKVLGTGCSNCKKLEKNVLEAVARLDIDASVEKVTDFKDIMKYGVMSTPALVVNEKVLFSGRVPSVSSLLDLLNIKV